MAYYALYGSCYGWYYHYNYHSHYYYHYIIITIIIIIIIITIIIIFIIIIIIIIIISSIIVITACTTSSITLVNCNTTKYYVNVIDKSVCPRALRPTYLHEWDWRAHLGEGGSLGYALHEVHPRAAVQQRAGPPTGRYLERGDLPWKVDTGLQCLQATNGKRVC